MGRKLKFGEESVMVSVRVPKSKAREYRAFINRCVEYKFANHSSLNTDKIVDNKLKSNSTKSHDIMDTINRILKHEKN